MTPDALNFESDIRHLISQGDLDGALGFVRFMVDHIRHDPASVGQTLASPALDRLCSEIGAASLHQLRNAGQLPTPDIAQADVVIVATEFYATGGHTRVIEDIVAAQPNMRYLVLLTDFFATGASYTPPLDADIRIAATGQRIDKLTWLQRELACHPAAQVLVFNHHADAAAIAAVQAGLNREVVFCHHADHHLCLGARMQSVRHVDFFAPYHHRCCESDIKAEYWPLSVPDRGFRPQTTDSFCSRGTLVTCTSGVWSKFNPLYPFHYWEELPGILHASGGIHIHIGEIPDELLVAMREHLVTSGVAAERLIYIPRVASVWDTLIEKEVDLYIGSFPIGGGRAVIEALGAGVPLVTHRHPLDPMLGTCGFGPADTWAWSTPAELQDILTNATREALAIHSKAAREHYLAFHNPDVFMACVTGSYTVTKRPAPPPLSDDVSAYLLRSMTRQDEVSTVFEQLKQRLANNANLKASPPDLDQAIGLFREGQLEHAYAALSQIVAHSPDNPLALIYLGRIASAALMPDDAEVFFQHAVDCSQERANTLAAIGQHCLEDNQAELAERFFTQALQDNPDLPGAYELLTDAWQQQGRFAEALESLHSHVQRDIDAHAQTSADILLRLIKLAASMGKTEIEYAACMHAARYPDCHCRAVSLLGQRENVSRTDLSTEARCFATAHANTPASSMPFGHRERLRVGFVVGRLAANSIAKNLEPVLCHLDPRHFETLLFFDEIIDAGIAQRLSLIVDQSHSIAAQETSATATDIRNQQIDLLVNLELHDHWPSLRLFEQRCAPLQLNWSEPPRTSALANMDYVLCRENEFSPQDFSEQALTLAGHINDSNWTPDRVNELSNALLALWHQHGGSLESSR